MSGTNFTMPGGLLTDVNGAAFRAINQSYISGRLEDFPSGQMVARVSAPMVAKLEGIVLPDDNSQSFLCRHLLIRQANASSNLTEGLWNRCKKEVFFNLHRSNEQISKEVISSNVENVMSIVGSVIALDLRHFDDQYTFRTSLALDRIGGGSDGAFPSFHNDPYDRMYVIRLGARPTEIIDMSCPSTQTGALDKSELATRLLSLAETSLPKQDYGYLKDLFARQRQDIDHNNLAGLAQLVGRWRLTNVGDVVVMDRNTIHRSLCADPDDAQTNGMLINVAIYTNPRRGMVRGEWQRAFGLGS